MEKKTYVVGKLSRAIACQLKILSAVTSGNGFVFVSGLPPVNHVTGELVRGDILVQTRQCLENVKAALEVAGSSLDKVLKVTIYAVNCAYFNDINAIYAEYFPRIRPPGRSARSAPGPGSSTSRSRPSRCNPDEAAATRGSIRRKSHDRAGF